MFRWSVVTTEIKFRIVWLILLENDVDGSEQHSRDSDNGFLVSPAFFQREVSVLDFRMLIALTDSKRTLYQQRLDIRPGSADSGSFLLSCALVVLRRKASPGAEVLRGWEHGHLHTDFRNDTD